MQEVTAGAGKSRKLFMTGLVFLMFLVAGCGGGGGGGGGSAPAADTTSPTATLSFTKDSPILTTDTLTVLFSESMDTTTFTSTNFGNWTSTM